MTEQERLQARRLIDQARREQLTLFPLCDYCELPFEPSKGAAAQRFCSHAHRTYAFNATARGREIQNASRRRRRLAAGAIPRQQRVAA